MFKFSIKGLLTLPNLTSFIGICKIFIIYYIPIFDTITDTIKDPLKQKMVKGEEVKIKQELMEEIYL